MSNMSGNEKDNEVTPGSNTEEPKKKPDLDDTLSRLLRRKADVDEKDEDEGDGSAD